MELPFNRMTEAQLRQWVEANPERVNDRDGYGSTPLYHAARRLKSLPLIVWLLDEKGADINARASHETTPLEAAATLDILIALLDRGADPTVRSDGGSTLLMCQAFDGRVDCVARLLQDSRVRATINVQNKYGDTALHDACFYDGENETSTTSMLHLLLQAGANPAVTNNDGETPLAVRRHRYPSRHAAIALLEQAPDAEMTSLLVKARRLVTVSRNTVAPFYLQRRVVDGLPLPRVALAPVAAGLDENEEEEEEEGRTFRSMLAFVFGMEGGPEDTGMPRDVFRVVLDVLMPTWDPLRRKNVRTQPAPQG